MRLEVSLRSTVEAEYDVSYHHSLRSVLWECLRDDFSEIHDSNEPVGLSFSNIFPWGRLAIGDSRKLRISSPNREVLESLADGLLSREEISVGEMEFEVNGLEVQAPDVGEPGTRGYLETATGVVCQISPKVASEYGLDVPEGDAQPTFWRTKYGLEPLKHVISRSIVESHRRFGSASRYDDSNDLPTLFDSFDPIKSDVTYAIPFEPTAGVELTYIVSKWRLGYRVRDDTHRYLLNLALDCGIGQRREHGFGFVNTYTN